MADKNSLYHEIRKQIAVRQSHPALQSKGEIEFIYAEENTYPLAYVRSADTERILVIINPSAKESRFDSDLPAGKVIYSYQAVSPAVEASSSAGTSAAAKKEGGTFVAPPCSVSYLLL